MQQWLSSFRKASTVATDEILVWEVVQTILDKALEFNGKLALNLFIERTFVIRQPMTGHRGSGILIGDVTNAFSTDNVRDGPKIKIILTSPKLSHQIEFLSFTALAKSTTTLLPIYDSTQFSYLSNHSS